MVKLGLQIKELAKTYLDTWLQLQITHKASMQTKSQATRGFVMLSGPCDDRKGSGDKSPA